MFSLFKKDPVKKLKKEYNDLLEKGMQAQRSGDIKSYSKLAAEADEKWKKIQALEASAG